MERRTGLVKGSGFLYVIVCFVAYASAVDPCNEFKSCGQCIQSNNLCGWCQSYPVNSTLDRCRSLTNTSCQDFVYPESNITSKEDEDFGDLQQVKPQRVSVDLRVGDPFELGFTIRPSRSYPLDLYFLIDYSGSLVDFIDALKNLTQDLSSTLRNISDNSRVGLGIFVDKPVKPFMSTHPDSGTQIFSFIHVLNFTSNTSKLIDALSERNATQNLDNPEGLLDGLMQAAVCDNEIGWRKEGRRLIFSLTDAAFKTAGHGKYTGILTPNDGQCHLQDNEYAAATEYDYASMGHLGKVFAEKEIISLLGVPRISQSNIQNYHNSLAEVLEGARKVDITNDNVVQRIDEIYRDLSAAVRAELQTNVDGLDVKIELRNCSGKIVNNECVEALFEQEVDFIATFTAMNCTDELQRGTEVVIRSLFFGTITVNVRVICSCQCESEKPTTNSEECSNNGKLVCGVCECDQSSYGLLCQCDKVENITNPSCPINDGKICSGFGTCDCGKCECDEDYYGDACECNNANCPLAQETNEICNGQTCNCNKCECDSGYTGDACDCSTSQEGCMKNENGSTLCEGNGDCKCNECMCRNGYGGTHCEVCVDGEQCDLQCTTSFTECVSCYTDIRDQTVVYSGSDQCSTVCTANTTVILIEAPPSSTTYSLNGTQGRKCFLGSGNCATIRFFVFRFSTLSTIIIVANKPSNCEAGIEPWVIAVPIVVGLLVLGIIILIAIKLFLVLMDYLEYRKFVKDVKDNTVGNMINPLYTAPQQQIDNPLYRAEH